MNVTYIYELLHSRSFYEKNGNKKFRFKNNSLIIDRCALMPFALYEEDGHYFIKVSTCVFLERDLRIECAHADGCTFHFYGKTTGLEALVLE